MAKGDVDRVASCSKAEIRFRQLCALGVGGLVAVPTLLGELRKVIPGSNAVIFYQRSGERAGVYYDSPDVAALMAQPDVQKLFYAEGYGDHDKTLFRPMHDFVSERGPRHIRHTLRASWDDYLKSDLYNLFSRPAEQHAFVRLQIREGAEYVGMVGVYRGPHDPEFGVTELDTLGRLEPYLVHALASRTPPSDVAEAENGHSAMLLVDAHGRLQWMTPGTRALLALALGSADAPLPEPALRTVRSLLALERGATHTPAPSWSCRSRWGRFEFRAHRLESIGGGETMVGITVTRFVPLPLRLFEALGELHLAPRQSDVALRLALGRTQDEVASDLGLSRATVIYHRRQIYDRLGVETREKLVERLLSLHRPTLPP